MSADEPIPADAGCFLCAVYDYEDAKWLDTLGEAIDLGFVDPETFKLIEAS